MQERMGHPHIDTGAPKRRPVDMPPGTSAEDLAREVSHATEDQHRRERRDRKRAEKLAKEIKHELAVKQGSKAAKAKRMAGGALATGAAATTGAVGEAGASVLKHTREGLSEMRKGTEDWGSGELKKHAGWLKYVPVFGKWLLGTDPEKGFMRALLGTKDSLKEQAKKREKDEKKMREAIQKELKPEKESGKEDKEKIKKADMREKLVDAGFDMDAYLNDDELLDDLYKAKSTKEKVNEVLDDHAVSVTDQDGLVDDLIKVKKKK